MRLGCRATAARLAGLLIAASVVGAAPAHAAGGPHIVDDAGTVAQGDCEVEAYGNTGPDVTGLGRAWRLVLSPTCAFKALGNFEIGVIAAAAGPPGARIIPGVSVKTGLGRIGPARLAVEASLGFDPEGNQQNYVSTNLPVSFDLAPWLELHANAGVDFEPGNAGIPTFGVAALVTPLAGWQLVAEIAGRRGFATRGQWGVRHSTAKLNLDLMYSRSIDDSARGNWLTFGLTWRFAHGR